MAEIYNFRAFIESFRRICDALIDVCIKSSLRLRFLRNESTYYKHRLLGSNGYLQRLAVVKEEAKKKHVHQCKHAHKSNEGRKHIPFCQLCFMMMGLLPVARSTLVEFPNNTVDWRDGSWQEIVVSCRSDYPGPLKWYVQRIHNVEKEALYNGFYLRPDAKSYCTVTSDEPGKIDLHVWLRNITDAAQTYICLEPGTLEEASADLIWIESDLVCTQGSSEDRVNLTCSIEFRGNWAPTMEWKEQSIQGEEVLSVGFTTTTVPNQRVTSTFIMEVQKDSRNYTCTVKFDVNGKPQTTTAKNVPNYNRVWTFSTFSKRRDEKTKEQLQPVISIIVVAVVLIPVTVALVIVALIRRERRNRKLVLGGKIITRSTLNLGYQANIWACVLSLFFVWDDLRFLGH